MAETIKIKTNADKEKSKRKKASSANEDKLLQRLEQLEIPSEIIEHDQINSEEEIPHVIDPSVTDELAFPSNECDYDLKSNDASVSLSADQSIQDTNLPQATCSVHTNAKDDELISFEEGSSVDPVKNDVVKLKGSSQESQDNILATTSNIDSVPNEDSRFKSENKEDKLDEQSNIDVSDSMTRSDTCEFPTLNLDSLEKKHLQQGLYADLTSLLTEATPSKVKSFTDAQLNTLYHNQQLIHNQQYVTGFLQEVKTFDKHEFYEIVLSYYRARNQLATAQHDIEILKTETDQQQDLVWQTQEFNITAQGECADRARVTTPFKYEKELLFPETVEVLTRKLKDILNLLHDHLALSCYESQFSRLQVEVYLFRLYEKNPKWLHISRGTPITAHIQRDASITGELANLRTCISILFAFQRKPVKDATFLKDTQAWLHKLISTFLRFSSLEDHVYLLNQVLRCPAGVAKWATQFIQPIDPPAVYPGVLFGHPLLDHYVNMMSILLMPIRQREEMLYQLHVTMTPPTDANKNPWIMVDSDGEEDEDPSNKWHFLQENDIVSLLNQLPMSTVFRHVLGVSQDLDGGDHYDPQSSFSEGTLLKLFAFATTLLAIMKKGMDVYVISRYRQLNKRLARIVSLVMAYVSDHLESCRLPLSLMSLATQERIQIEFDSLSFKAVTALVSANRFGAWQFLADLPYSQVSEAAIWRLFWKMHLSAEAEGANLETLNTQECIDQIRNTDNLHTFEDRLTTMATSEALYLLNTFANMACSRPTNTLFVKTVALEIYQIAFLDTHTREFCSRQGREMLSSVCAKHPQVLSNLLQCSNETMSCIGKVGMFLYSGLPLSLWKPSAEDLSVLQKWLVEYPSESIECQLAKTILERLNWGFDQSVNGNESGQLFLPRAVHYFIMTVVAGAYMAHLTGYPANYLFQEGSKKGYLWGGETDVDKLAQFLWDLSMQLHINVNAFNMVQLVQLDPLPEIATDDKYLNVSAAKEKGFGIGNYFMLVASHFGHNFEDFCCEGLDYLAFLIDKGYVIPALHAMSLILPLAYIQNNQPRLIGNSKFQHIMEVILRFDESRRQVFSYQFPGSITHLFSSMIQKHLQTNFEHAALKDIISFWLKSLTQTEWPQNRDTLYIIDNMLRACQKTQEAKNTVTELFKEIHQQNIDKAVSPGVLNWLAGNTGILPILEGQMCSDFPWLMYYIINAETNWEMKTGLWQSIHSVVSATEAKSFDANTYKVGF